jgi:hypothetical protein
MVTHSFLYTASMPCMHGTQIPQVRQPPATEHCFIPDAPHKPTTIPSKVSCPRLHIKPTTIPSKVSCSRPHLNLQQQYPLRVLPEALHQTAPHADYLHYFLIIRLLRPNRSTIQYETGLDHNSEIALTNLIMLFIHIVACWYP